MAREAREASSREAFREAREDVERRARRGVGREDEVGEMRREDEVGEMRRAESRRRRAERDATEEEDDEDVIRLSRREQELVRGASGTEAQALASIRELRELGFPVSEFELMYLTLPREERELWTAERKRAVNTEKKLAEQQGRELTELEIRQILKRVTDALNSPYGQTVLDLRAYTDSLDTTGMTREEARASRRALRREFLSALYADMTDEEIEAFRQSRQEFELSIATREMRRELTLRQREREEGRTEARPEAPTSLESSFGEVLADINRRNSRKVELASEAGIRERERPVSFRGIGPVRSRVLREIVQPRFQLTRHLDVIVRELHTLNPAAVPLTLLAQATAASSTPATGVTFFPPQNANPTIVYPWRARFAPPSRPLPSYMNWGDSANVAAVRGWALPRTRLSRASRVKTDKQGYLHEVVDQLGCGSCWVISVAAAMSDRASIWTQQANPQLSVTNILGCVSGDGDEGPVVEGAAMYSPATAGCAGGIPMGAVEMFANFGDASSACVGYEWCENDPVCNATKRLGFSDAPAYLNSMMPACADMLDTCIECENGDCGASDTVRNAWGLETYPSGRPYILLTDILSIQQELAAHGPVVATHAVFGDFQAGTAAIVGDGWAKTRGVYCNVQTSGPRRPYNGTRYAGAERQLIGYHAVVIVGWGVEAQVPDWEHPGDTLDIPYWIVRNSWSPAWNPDCVVNGIPMPGYCKIAFTDPTRNLNTHLYLDNAEDGMVGAAIAFMPMVTRIEPARRGQSQIDENPEMSEEKIQSLVEDTEVTLASTRRDASMPAPDPDEIARDQINHPILCSHEPPAPTPLTTRKVNCPSKPNAAASRLSSQTSTGSQVQGGVLAPMLITLLLVTILVALLVILIKRTQKQ